MLGIHILGPSAGEVMQGFAVAMRLGATKVRALAACCVPPTCLMRWSRLISIAPLASTLRMQRRSWDWTGPSDPGWMYVRRRSLTIRCLSCCNVRGRECNVCVCVWVQPVKTSC